MCWCSHAYMSSSIMFVGCSASHQTCKGSPVIQALVQSAVASPETPISRLGIMTAPEHERVLRAFNAVEVLSSDLLHPQQTIHGLFEHWAAATPDAHAVLYEVQHPPIKS